MSNSETLNLASLKMVQDELVATIEQSAVGLEQFANDRNNGELLQNCIDGIKQIRGTLSLIQLKGVDLLAEELVEHITEITLGEETKTNRKLELLTSAFFILPRYLEYCTQTSRSMAMLLIPHINELRQARKAPLVPESHFYQYEPPTGVARPASAAPLNEDLMALVRRLRHMYQTGLLKVLQGVQVKPSLGMMCRAMDRLDAASGTAPFGNLWWVASAAFTAISDKDMQLTKGRKLLFSALDREIKRLQMEGKQSLARQPDKNLLKDLLYIVALSRATDDKVRAVATAYDIKPVRYTDAELAREMEFLKGPSANTLNSMAAVLSDELRSTKNILERAAQGGAELLSETPELVDTLKKVADILSVVGLVAPSTSLKQEIEKIAHWQKTKKPVSPDELLGVADTLLYVESTISGLGKVNLSDEKLAQINALSRDDAMAHSQIAEAERLVIEEAESGLAMVKRALSSFIESNYDKAHIHNIVGTLDSVRGGMFVLGLSRAAKVLAKCIEFIEVSLLRNEQMAAVQHMLETFADAIISLEYYLDSIKIDKNADTSVLEIAEESLEALGYRV
ncbi:pilus assembly protein [Cellvibrio sp. PSBB006]|uniref:pilus assembly protein n=1 Tax=Cellvibrio sp. PSBB006 TaxID=1987723 RepID=UPI000B3B50C1|nr:pilus assembly protein [Cellvibrio sp. PSBB006]ARU26454.1 pilus assembly protein [Cellvibrio sp. PSBB006]